MRKSRERLVLGDAPVGSEQDRFEGWYRQLLPVLADLAATAPVVEGDVAAAADPRARIHHLVAWAWVTSSDRASTVLVRHHRTGRWMPPGGLAELDEHPSETARRELREETGLVLADDPAPVFVDVITHPLPDGTPAFSFGVAYHFTVDAERPVVGEPNQPARWWPLEHLAHTVEPVDQRHLARLQRHVARA